MILPWGLLISAGPAASSHLGQAHSTSPVASARQREVTVVLSLLGYIFFVAYCEMSFWMSDQIRSKRRCKQTRQACVRDPEQ
jgi:hypothetical protein